MKLTRALFAQHIGKMFRDHWKIQGRKTVRDHGALKSLIAHGIEFETSLDFLKEPSKRYANREHALNHEVQLIFKKVEHLTYSTWDRMIQAPRNNVEFPFKTAVSDADLTEITCMAYGDHSVLLEGLDQAKMLTNTVEFGPESLPVFIESSDDREAPLQDKLVKRYIRSSIMYDATQEKLPKLKDPLREAWNFPRVYGITDKRRNYLLVNRLLHFCSICSPDLLSIRKVVNSAKFILPVTLPTDERILFTVTGDAVIFANKYPAGGETQELADLEVPDISPLAPTISLESIKTTKFEPSFPLTSDAELNKIHTVVLFYNETQVANIFESPVVLGQILGRSLMQAWIFAMCQAIQDCKEEMDRPITVQLVHTNGQLFHFSVLQLNSTSCGLATAPKNFYWSFPVMKMYDRCTYIKGSPVFEGYNPKVFRTLLAFYNNTYN